MRTAALLALLAAASPATASQVAGNPAVPPAAAPVAGSAPVAIARGGRPGPAVHESYAPALAEARARGVPLLVDVWAPW